MAAVMALIILAATQGSSGARISGWADASMIWLILPILGVALVAVVILFALVYLLARVLKILPFYTGIVQLYVGMAAEKVKYFLDLLLAPFIRIKSTLAGIKGVSKKVGGRNKGHHI